MKPIVQEIDVVESDAGIVVTLVGPHPHTMTFYTMEGYARACRTLGWRVRCYRCE